MALAVSEQAACQAPFVTCLSLRLKLLLYFLPMLLMGTCGAAPGHLKRPPGPHTSPVLGLHAERLLLHRSGDKDQRAQDADPPTSGTGCGPPVSSVSFMEAWRALSASCLAPNPPPGLLATGASEHTQVGDHPLPVEGCGSPPGLAECTDRSDTMGQQVLQGFAAAAAEADPRSPQEAWASHTALLMLALSCSRKVGACETRGPAKRISARLFALQSVGASQLVFSAPC